MHRLLVEKSELLSDRPRLSREAAKHLKVLRPKEGEPVELFDGAGSMRTYRVNGAELSAAGDLRTLPRRGVEVCLFACVTKGSRWDWTIEKAVELGASEIVPVISDRCIVRLSAEERTAKAERWMRIAEDAARQSDAAWLPSIRSAVNFPESLEIVKGCDKVFVGALVQPPPMTLFAAVQAMPRDVRRVGVFVGPEGDFTPGELASLLAIAEPVSFGPTILRAETAAVFGLSVLVSALQ